MKSKSFIFSIFVWLCIICNFANATYAPTPTQDLIPLGIAGQYYDGTKTWQSLPITGNSTCTNPARAISTCYQASATKDADVTFSVDIYSGLLAIATGSASIVTYTNSLCTLGATTLPDSVIGGVAVGATTSLQITGVIPAGKWYKITGTATAALGLPTATLRPAQQECIRP